MTDYGVTVKKIILRRAMKWLSERSLPLQLARTYRKENADSKKKKYLVLRCNVMMMQNVIKA